MNLLILGDSHAKCRLPGPLGSDSDIIAERLNVPAEFRLAVSGSTALEWALDLDQRLSRAQSLGSRCTAALVSLLGNDLRRAADEGKVELSEVAASLSAFYEVLRSVAQVCPRVFVLQYAYPYRDNNARNMLALEALDGAIAAVCETVRVVSGFGSCVETLDERGILSRGDWPGDDLHPFASGYEKIAAEIERRVKEGKK